MVHKVSNIALSHKTPLGFSSLCHSNNKKVNETFNTFCIKKYYSLAISLYQIADNTQCSEWYLFVAVHHFFIYINSYYLYFLPSPVSPSPTALFLLQVFISVVGGKIWSARYLVVVSWTWLYKLCCPIKK